ncbi:hypothetical protein N9514_04990, partial [Pseudomonadales bacterium]|nr:hypothetical protein [Pseudomonadales bacterium]
MATSVSLEGVDELHLLLKEKRHLQATIESLRTKLERSSGLGEEAIQQHQVAVSQEVSQLKATIQALRLQLELAG